jgi:hypothetical protein
MGGEEAGGTKATRIARNADRAQRGSRAKQKRTMDRRASKDIGSRGAGGWVDERVTLVFNACGKSE